MEKLGELLLKEDEVLLTISGRRYTRSELGRLIVLGAPVNSYHLLRKGGSTLRHPKDSVGYCVPQGFKLRLDIFRVQPNFPREICPVVQFGRSSLDTGVDAEYQPHDLRWFPWELNFEGRRLPNDPYVAHLADTYLEAGQYIYVRCNTTVLIYLYGVLVPV